MLTHLNLSSCRLITDSGIAQLASMPLTRTLHTLSLSNCRLLTDGSIMSLQNLGALQRLSLYGLKEARPRCHVILDYGLCEHGPAPLSRRNATLILLA